MIKKTALLMAFLLLFNSCYNYKRLDFEVDDFKINQNYEIRVGQRKMEKVKVVQVTDSTIVVMKNKNRVAIQKSMITESRLRKLSTGKTIIGSVVGVLVSFLIIGAIATRDGYTSNLEIL